VGFAFEANPFVQILSTFAAEEAGVEVQAVHRLVVNEHIQLLKVMQLTGGYLVLVAGRPIAAARPSASASTQEVAPAANGLQFSLTYVSGGGAVIKVCLPYKIGG
jgi:hypothetical protein